MHGVRASFDGMVSGVYIVSVQITPTQITHLVANIIGDESFMKKSGIKVRYIILLYTHERFHTIVQISLGVIIDTIPYVGYSIYGLMAHLCSQFIHVFK